MMYFSIQLTLGLLKNASLVCLARWQENLAHIKWKGPKNYLDLYTDVCGPFKIMSRQGASYFVTFTDDFSRYGYVYLFNHKHEVFETFKVFQKEVENQLGLRGSIKLKPGALSLYTMRDFHSCKQEERQSVSSYLLKMKRYIDNLERLGHPVITGLGVSLILIALRKEFDSFVQNYNTHNIGKTINELHAMLKLHEQTLPKNNAPALHAIRAGKVQKGNKQHKKPQSQSAARGQNQGKGKNKLAYAPKPKIPPPPKREDPDKDSVC
nr:zinc finger, CCHC-type [Tanacetum cinerariifolium]